MRDRVPKSWYARNVIRSRQLIYQHFNAQAKPVASRVIQFSSAIPMRATSGRSARQRFSANFSPCEGGRTLNHLRV